MARRGKIKPEDIDWTKVQTHAAKLKSVADSALYCPPENVLPWYAQACHQMNQLAEALCLSQVGREVAND
jgi:hypothetical protein